MAADGFYRVRRNLDAIRSTGLEVDARWDRGPWSVRAPWSHVDPRVEASGEVTALAWLRPAQTPRDLLSGSLAWRRGGVVISGTVRHAARQFDDDLNTRALAPATTLDSYLALPATRALAVQLRGENLFDDRVEAGISGVNIIERATPRTVWIGLRLRG